MGLQAILPHNHKMLVNELMLYRKNEVTTPVMPNFSIEIMFLSVASYLESCLLVVMQY